MGKIGITLIAIAVMSGTNAQVGLKPFVSGLERPIWATFAPGEPNRMYILEQSGTIRIVESGKLTPKPFIDLSSKISCCGERGLLGMAFHPNYAQNHTFFLNYTNPSGNTVVSRFSKPDLSSEEILITIKQPYSNHNGGMIGFGPDGYLYIGMGDGGSGGDPQNNAQNLNSLLGKILRIDVDSSKKPYGIPATNPFIKNDKARPEIWAYGVRNPWRFSFDRQTGDLWMGDVGQNKLEEINVQPSSSKGGENYGWRRLEGNKCYNPDNCDVSKMTDTVLPVITYDHSEGVSVTGGYLYRGKANPNWVGKYIYGDFGSSRIWVASKVGNSWKAKDLGKTGLGISSFAEDLAGELYVLDYGSGTVYKLNEK